MDGAGASLVCTGAECIRLTDLVPAAAEAAGAVPVPLGKNRPESLAWWAYAISGSIAGENALGVGSPEDGVELALDILEPQIGGGLWS
ncbi:hypothetical protein FRC12_022468 [Ceratobasidium sp. 428]|nr:hypothetical protein FRC12_022468 [Ceratobasidium sp. 428]